MVFVDKNFQKLKIFLTVYLFPKLQDNNYKYIFIYLSICYKKMNLPK